MSRLTNKDDRGRYYTVEEKILIANEPVNPTTTWIVHNENRRYGSPIEKLGKLEDLEEQLGCPLDVFVKLTLGQKIWVEVDGMKCYEGNHYAEIDTSFGIDEDDWGETEFWAWYDSYLGDYTKASDHVILKLKDYKKTWWLKKDKSE